MSNIQLDSDDILVQRMQAYRVDIIESIMTPVPDSQGRLVDIREMDPKLIRTALVAMTDVDNSIIKRSRLDLDKKSLESSEQFQETMVEVMKNVLDKGGLALRDDTTPGTPQEAPSIQLDSLPNNQITSEEAQQGIEHIEFDDIMKKPK